MDLQYIPRNMHTVFALLCFLVVIHWLIFPYPSGLLHWHCGNLTIAPVPAKQPWWIWINTSFEFIMNDYITTTKQSTTKACAYFLGNTVFPSIHYGRTYTYRYLRWVPLMWLFLISAGVLSLYVTITATIIILRLKQWCYYFVSLMRALATLSYMERSFIWHYFLFWKLQNELTVVELGLSIWMPVTNIINWHISVSLKRYETTIHCRITCCKF